MAEAAYDLYLEYLRRSLTGLLEQREFVESKRPSGVKGLIYDQIRKRGLTIGRYRTVNVEDRKYGRDWPSDAITMIGLDRLDNIRECVERVLKEDVPGDIIETGVWRGGASIYAKGVLAANGDNERQLYLADSFQGLPPPDPETFPGDANMADLSRYEVLAASATRVRENFRTYGLLDERVQLVEGWFRDTLPSLVGHTWAVIRLDGDYYESTILGLENLYPDLSVGGYVIIDDYGGIDACKAAVEDFRRDHGVTDEIQEIDWTGVFWRKTM